MNLKIISRFYQTAGIYGIVVLLPHYFLEAQISQMKPPAITHPEFYYGFTGVALAFQFLFFVVAKDPVRYVYVMPICALEKLSFFLAVSVLFVLGRVEALLLVPALIDLILGMGFFICYRKTLSTTRTA